MCKSSYQFPELKLEQSTGLLKGFTTRTHTAKYVCIHSGDCNSPLQWTESAAPWLRGALTLCFHSFCQTRRYSRCHCHSGRGHLSVGLAVWSLGLSSHKQWDPPHWSPSRRYTGLWGPSYTHTAAAEICWCQGHHTAGCWSQHEIYPFLCDWNLSSFHQRAEARFPKNKHTNASKYSFTTAGTDLA